MKAYHVWSRSLLLDQEALERRQNQTTFVVINSELMLTSSYVFGFTIGFVQ